MMNRTIYQINFVQSSPKKSMEEMLNNICLQMYFISALLRADFLMEWRCLTMIDGPLRYYLNHVFVQWY